MSERKSALGCIFWGCATCVGLLVVGIGACVMMFHYGKKSVLPAADQYLDAVEGGEFARAYELVGDQWRERQSLDEFTAFERGIRDQLGPCPSRSTAGIEMSATGEGSQADITYLAQCEKGRTQITVTLRKSGRSWKVDGVHYDVPSHREVSVCPECGAEHAAEARFCSQCGHALTAEEATDAGPAPPGEEPPS